MPQYCCCSKPRLFTIHLSLPVSQLKLPRLHRPPFVIEFAEAPFKEDKPATEVSPTTSGAAPASSASFEPGRLRGCRYLTTPHATKRTLEIAVDLRHTEIKDYSPGIMVDEPGFLLFFPHEFGDHAPWITHLWPIPGDAFMIACPNRAEEVQELIQLLHLEAEAGG